MVFDHVLDLIGAEHRDDDAACRSCQLGNRLSGLAADLGQPRSAGRIDVETGYWDIRVDKTAGIDLAHQTKTDDGNRSAHCETPSGLCMCILPV